MRLLGRLAIRRCRFRGAGIVTGTSRLDVAPQSIDKVVGGAHPDRQRDELHVPRPQLIEVRLHLAGRGERVIEATIGECDERSLERRVRRLCDAPLVRKVVGGRSCGTQLASDRGQLGGLKRQAGLLSIGLNGRQHAGQAFDRVRRLVHVPGRRHQLIGGSLQVRAGRIGATDRAGASVPASLEGPAQCSIEGSERRGRARRLGLHGRIARVGHSGVGASGIGRAHAEQEADAEHGGDQRNGEARATRPSPYHAAVDLIDAFRGLPKAELHQHLDGAVRPATAVELAAAIGMALSPDEAQRRLIAPPHCADQAELLTYFDLPIALLQTSEALRRVTAELIEDLMADGVRYAEIRWAPRLHLAGGLSTTAVIEAVATGIAEAAARNGPSTPLIGLIVAAMRSHPPGANVELARTAAAFGPPVVGFDLAGPEAAYPAPPHAAAFLAAAEGGLALTAHAGEVAGPERIREVLDFNVRRIAHGVTAAQDPALVELLIAREVTLDLCPTSNVQAGIVTELAAHPLAELHRAGVSVTISTDDRTVSDVSLSEEMARTMSALALTATEMAAIALNGFRRGFAPPAMLRHLETAAEAAWQSWLIPETA